MAGDCQYLWHCNIVTNAVGVARGLTSGVSRAPCLDNGVIQYLKPEFLALDWVYQVPYCHGTIGINQDGSYGPWCYGHLAIRTVQAMLGVIAGNVM